MKGSKCYNLYFKKLRILQKINAVVNDSVLIFDVFVRARVIKRIFSSILFFYMSH